MNKNILIVCSLVLLGAGWANAGSVLSDRFYVEMEKIDDPLFQSFWIEFRSAVSNKKREDVAELTNFPLPVWRKCIEKEDFIKSYDNFFFPEIVQGISESPNLVKSKSHPGSYYALNVTFKDADESDSAFFEFSKVENKFKLTRVGFLDTQCAPANQFSESGQSSEKK